MMYSVPEYEQPVNLINHTSAFCKGELIENILSSNCEAERVTRSYKLNLPVASLSSIWVFVPEVHYRRKNHSRVGINNSSFFI